MRETYTSNEMSRMKPAVNAFVAMMWRGGRAVVVDTHQMKSVDTLLELGVDPRKIWAINFNDISENVLESGTRRGVRTITAVSTRAFKKLARRRASVVYADYCGTPKGNKAIGFRPVTDARCIAKMIQKDNGLAVFTFSRRCTSSIDTALSVVRKSGMNLIGYKLYCDSSPMVVVFATTAGNSHVRRYAAMWKFVSNLHGIEEPFDACYERMEAFQFEKGDKVLLHTARKPTTAKIVRVEDDETLVVKYTGYRTPYFVPIESVLEHHVA